MRTGTGIALIGLVLLAPLSACVSGGPAGCESEAVTIELELRDGELVSEDPSVCRDQQVTLIVSADTGGTFHIHGYDHAIPAAEYTAEEPLELEFVADLAGQFSVEIHTDEEAGGVAIGIFTVHEP